MERLYTKGLLSKANGKYSVLASTSAIDRQGDSIDQKGWDIGNYVKNPVMLWAHNYSALPVAKATAVGTTPSGLTLDYEFAPAEGNPMAQQIKVLVDEGFLNAVSVGFMPLERNGNVITKMDLLEVSFVPVPANPQALQLMLSKGITTDVIERFFEVKKAELEVIEKNLADEKAKGAVADEISAEEAMEQKWAKCDAMWEILGAFYSVYLDEATPVASFSDLLNETLGLLQTLSDNDGANDDDSGEGDEGEMTQIAGLKEAVKKAVGKDAAKIFIEKIGASHSAATKKAINAAIEHNNASTDVLKALITAEGEASTEDDEEKQVSVEPVAEKETDEASGMDEVRALLITRNMLREETTGSQSALKFVNEFLREKRQPVEA